jgi:hypothetical protein
MHYIRVQKFFFTIWTSWVSKDAEFDVDFKNTNLPWQNAPKEIFQDKDFRQYTGGPQCSKEILFS